MLKLKHSGMTIIELMLVIALLALVLNLALPNLQEFLDKNRSLAIKHQLERTLLQARSLAVTRREKLQLCGSLDMQNCHTNWSSGWIIRRLSDQQNLFTSQLLNPQYQLKWDGFQKNIVFEPSGIGLTTNGRFYLCRNKQVDWQIVLNRQGRVRNATESENRQQDSKCQSSG